MALRKIPAPLFELPFQVFIPVPLMLSEKPCILRHYFFKRVMHIVSKFFYKGSHVQMQDNRGIGYKSKKTIRVGTEIHPAWVSVQTEERAEEILALAEAHQVVVEIAIDEEASEDTTQLDVLINKITTQVNDEKLPSRNDPCPCNSGKKYKKCCGA